MYPNRTQRYLKNPYKAHKYRLCRDLPICSRPTKNHPLVHPKIDLPGREKPILFPFSQRQSYNILFYIQLSVFGFNDLCVCLCLQASSASVPFSNLFKPYKPSLFLTFPVFFRIEEKGLVAWNRDAQSGCSCKKRSRARRISLKFI